MGKYEGNVTKISDIDCHTKNFLHGLRKLTIKYISVNVGTVQIKKMLI